MFKCQNSEIKFRIFLNHKNLSISPPLNVQSCIGQHVLADIVPKLQGPITQDCFSSTMTIFHCLFSFCFLFYKECCQSGRARPALSNLPSMSLKSYPWLLLMLIFSFFLNCQHLTQWTGPLFSDLRRDNERKEKFGHSIRKCHLCETLFLYLPSGYDAN